MYFMSLNYTLEMVKVVNFIMHVLLQFKRAKKFQVYMFCMSLFFFFCFFFSNFILFLNFT